MTKVFNVKLEPYYEELPLHFHGNGKRKDGTPRKRKVLVKAKQGMVNAKHYYYAMHHPEWDGKGTIMHLDGDDTNFSKDNLVLVDSRICKNVVHFNNNLYIKGNKDAQELGLLVAEATVKMKELSDDVTI